MNCGKVLDVICLSAKIFSDLWELVGRKMLHPQRGGFILVKYLRHLKMPPLSLLCWHCSPDNEDEGWYYWQHSEAGKDQLIILQQPNTNTGSVKYFCDAIKKHFQLQSSLQEWDSNKCPAVKWVLHFKIFSTLNICFEIWHMILILKCFIAQVPYWETKTRWYLSFVFFCKL